MKHFMADKRASTKDKICQGTKDTNEGFWAVRWETRMAKLQVCIQKVLVIQHWHLTYSSKCKHRLLSVCWSGDCLSGDSSLFPFPLKQKPLQHQFLFPCYCKPVYIPLPREIQNHLDATLKSLLIRRSLPFKHGLFPNSTANLTPWKCSKVP